ncbi:NADH dehydrogenase [ubiquinone] 1 beta subcomplex subunit 10-like [Mercenaria mercenaria]|uniref:NADH dehydrogenase [ubiquinone] 1 beta subcomplex subunit 10-like n=1 Tax=Mercenaria mercenaria TaxID=6596 RepID=UPI001E1D6C90|nr:NADH dehydrogenase [ubiquinone] 1 beta subcomplex subunit 10-like [Mercenaria mercenaria]
MSSAEEPSKRLARYAPESFWPSSLTKPIQYVREKFVLPFRQKERPVYYHRRFERVPTIDQCDIDDPLCRYEANVQFLRDKKVDSAILKILRRRLTECNAYWGADALHKCEKETETLKENMQNWYIRYGEIGYNMDVLEYYMKQKHRMIWLRRRKENGETDADYRD